MLEQLVDILCDQNLEEDTQEDDSTVQEEPDLQTLKMRYLKMILIKMIGSRSHSVAMATFAAGIIYSLLSLPRIPRDWTKYVELSVIRGNQIMTYG